MVSAIGQNDGVLSKCLCTLGSPCALAILASCDQIYLKVPSSNSTLLLSCFSSHCKVAYLVGVESWSICLYFDLSETF